MTSLSEQLFAVVRQLQVDPMCASAQEELYLVLKDGLGQELSQWSRHQLGYPMEPGEIAAVVWERIVTDPDQLSKLAEEARNPFGWLVSACRRKFEPGKPVPWLRAEGGFRATSIHGVSGEEQFAGGLEPLTMSATDDLLRRLVTRTLDVLLPRTPHALRDDVRSLTGWLAVNPPQQLSNSAADVAVAAAELPAVTLGQARAVANVTWGARNRRAETSLFGLFLRDQDADITDHCILYRSVKQYQERMHGRMSTARLERAA